MNTQQRSLFTATATSEVNVMEQQRKIPRLLHEHRFRFGSRIAAALAALLFCSCANLTPEQNAILVQLAANAAQIGLQLLLKERPEERTKIAGVVDAMNGLTSVGPITSKQTAALMKDLPTDTLKGDRAELYRSGKRLVIYDNLRGKAFTVPDGLAGEAVARAIRQGMQRALEPLPPVPVTPVRRAMAAQQPPTIVYVTNQTVILVPEPPARPATHYTLEALPGGPTTNAIKSSALGTASFKAAQRVGIYRVERKDGTNWVEIQSFTDVPVGEWRVRRVR